MLRCQFPEMDESVLDYVSYIAKDASLNEEEKIASICEYLSACFDVDQDLSELVRDFVRDQTPCPPVSASPATIALEILKTGPAVTNFIQPASTLKWNYDVIGKYETISEDSNDEEILGLGPNENRLRIIREREESRTKAKSEQAEAHNSKVMQKLKAYGDTMKDRTVRRKK